ncbi:MAG: N-6 DNA methylase [Caldilineaceae bacterium]|nr:N-6 DNA methylase [Caldilineaceae bacterium]MBP8108928.1 N-6 DNA methylase [Caldilineaceae bacterium]MBP8124055.1 N-6 DNA methylase [Caldilineaceae bacterium]
MISFTLKPTHKAVADYYAELEGLAQLSLFGEGAVAPAFANLLRAATRGADLTLGEQYVLKRGGRVIRVDGALLDAFKLPYGYWEAKDSADDLDVEIKKKFQVGYPKENIIFQAPERAVVVQDGNRVFDGPITEPDDLVEALRVFFTYQPPAFERWQEAVGEFKNEVPKLAQALIDLIERERRANKKFIIAFDNFANLCRETINPNLADQAVEEMLIQHLLTERIFRRVFNNPDFVNRNAIAAEIETVIRALTSQQFSRHDFFKPLDRFYGAIESTAATIEDFSQKQDFLNTVYENFFQGFSVKVADTHGIVYTPQPIVDFMVRSVDVLLQREFGRGLADPGVHVLDPFVGTGNFILRVMRHLQEEGKLSRLPAKYADALHCNEVMLLPYYIAAMNIEHEYFEMTGAYVPFPGICLVDTFDLAEGLQPSLFAPENTERVQRQQAADITVVIGNPPYNAWQVNENDNNKNRSYPVVDKRVAETYAAASKATNKNALSDPYVKAFRWASDRIGEEGIVTYISNGSYVDDLSFDGMRRCLGEEFDAVYVLDLGGNVRKNPKLSGTTHNVFGIQVGVSIAFLVRRAEGLLPADKRVYYARVDEFWRKGQKYDFLDQSRDVNGVKWQEITPNQNSRWLTEGMEAEFDTFLPLSNRSDAHDSDGSIFLIQSVGAQTNKDAWLYNFDKIAAGLNVRKLLVTYNAEVDRWQSRTNRNAKLDSFILSDDSKISWSSRLKECLARGQKADFDEAKLFGAVYRPFCKQHLYFDDVLVHRRSQFPMVFSNLSTDNRLISLTDRGSEKPFMALMTDRIADLHIVGAGASAQCFPFYTYDEDGSHRRENITDWALAQFQDHYADPSIDKWAIFHYVYALLHHPAYREKYAANLRRALPRLPFAPDFHAFAQAGRALADLHVNYEAQPEYALDWVETKGAKLNFAVHKMKLAKDKSSLRYNDFLTLAGLPPAIFDYKLGNRSALEWIIDRYQVNVDKRSGIVNDPNQYSDDPRYIVKLIGQVVHVSVETVKIVAGLPEME